MIRCSLPVFLSLLLLGALLAAPGARGQDLPPAARQDTVNDDAADQDAAGQDGRTPAASNARSNDGRISVTRSDGSTGHTKAPDPKQIRKLVSYIRAGMKRADNADHQRQTRRVNRRAIRVRR
jgi:hypothetical protein